MCPCDDQSYAHAAIFHYLLADICSPILDNLCSVATKRNLILPQIADNRNDIIFAYQNGTNK
jgi:hypothetical protein